MAKNWTRGERKDKLKERFKHTKQKLFSLLFIAIVFFALISIFVYGVGIGADPFLLGVLAVIILVLIPISIFFVDTLWHEI